jgi:hypothetical protein
MKLIEEGDACPKNKCTAGSPMCDKCEANYGMQIREKRIGTKVVNAIFVKCACGFGSLAGVFKRFFTSW